MRPNISDTKRPKGVGLCAPSLFLIVACVPNSEPEEAAASRAAPNISFVTVDETSFVEPGLEGLHETPHSFVVCLSPSFPDNSGGYRRALTAVILDPQTRLLSMTFQDFVSADDDVRVRFGDGSVEYNILPEAPSSRS